MTFAKKILGGTAILSLAAVATRAMGLVSSPILTRLLGPEPYGAISLVGTIVTLGGTLALFGRETGYTRFGLQGSIGHRQRVECYLWKSVIFSAFVTSIFFSIAWFAAGPVMAIEARPLATFLGVSLFFSPILAMATVRRRLKGQYGAIALASIFSSVAGIISSICWAIFISRDVWALAIGLLTTTAINVSLLRVPRLTSLIRPSGLERSIKRSALYLGLPSVVTAPIYWAIMSLDRWAIQSNAGVLDVGIYAYAAQFGLLGAMINNALMITWLPETSRIYDVDGTAALPVIGLNCTRLLAALLIIWLAVSASGGDLLRLLSADSFHSGAVFIPWIAAGVLFYGVSSLFVAPLFICRRMRFMVVAWIVGGSVAVLSYIILSPRLGALGVAIGQAVGFLTIAAATWLASIRTLALPLPYIRIGIVFVGTALLVCLMSPAWSAHSLLSLCLKLPIGLIAALVVLGVLSPELFDQANRRLRALLHHNSRTKAD